ncbi:MAG TPA: Mur ligase domain-containing protein, partial [Nitrospiria bacterium]|nr:Mur ligase domain-containing protein [Nitrospiria bacterium]
MVVFGRFGGGTWGEAERFNRPVSNVEGKPCGMKLRELIDAVPGSRVAGSADVEIDRLSSDSRVVGPGTLFFALAGEHQDGHSFIEEAVGRGARAVVAGEDYRGDPGVP